jgi:hypothetical protein
MGKEQLRQFILEYLSPEDYKGRLQMSKGYEKYRKKDPRPPKNQLRFFPYGRSTTDRSGRGGAEELPMKVTPRLGTFGFDDPNPRSDRQADNEIDRLAFKRQQRVDRVKKGRRSLGDFIRNLFGTPNAPEPRKTKLQRKGFTKLSTGMGGTNPDKPNVGFNKPYGMMRPLSGQLGKSLYRKDRPLGIGNLKH